MISIYKKISQGEWPSHDLQGIWSCGLFSIFQAPISKTIHSCSLNNEERPECILCNSNTGTRVHSVIFVISLKLNIFPFSASILTFSTQNHLILTYFTHFDTTHFFYKYYNINGLYQNVWNTSKLGDSA
jgi:hypothetical protein